MIVPTFPSVRKPQRIIAIKNRAFREARETFIGKKPKTSPLVDINGLPDVIAEIW